MFLQIKNFQTKTKDFFFQDVFFQKEKFKNKQDLKSFEKTNKNKRFFEKSNIFFRKLILYFGRFK